MPWRPHSGFPGLIGALEVKAAGRDWFKYQAKIDPSLKLAEQHEEESWSKVSVQPPFPSAHLWDGGVYDNHGLEGIHDFRTGWSKRFGFLIVSDAAGRGGEEPYRKGIPAIMRLSTGIMMNQVRSLRTRAIIERLANHPQEDQGVFLQTGNTCKYIIESAHHADWLPQFCEGAMPEEEADKVATMGTVIRKLTQEEYERLYHHGYEVADATLCAYYPEIFKHLPYILLIPARSRPGDLNKGRIAMLFGGCDAPVGRLVAAGLIGDFNRHAVRPHRSENQLPTNTNPGFDHVRYLFESSPARNDNGLQKTVTISPSRLAETPLSGP